MACFFLLPVSLPPGGRGALLIWPIQVCATEQAMAFKVLSLEQGIQFHY